MSLPNQNTVTTSPENEVHSLLASLVKASPAVLYSCKVSEDYGTIAVTENVRSVLGYAPEDFVGDPSFWALRIHPDDSARVFGEMPRLFHQGEQTIDYRFRHGSGNYICLRDHMKIESDDEGHPRRLFGCWLVVSGQRVGALFATRISDHSPETTTTATLGGDYAKQT